MPSLTDRRFLAGKAAASSVLAWAIVDLLGNPDAVSAAFVAVICTSPIILSGLKRARDQIIGSLIGGAVAALFLMMGAPFPIALGGSVAIAVWGTMAAGFEAGYLVAAFTAIYLLLIPRGTPAHTLAVRLSAVAVGGTAAVLVNGLVSLLMYARIFRRKVAMAVTLVSNELQALVLTADPPPGGVEPLFATLGTLQGELADAVRELRWRRGSLLHGEVVEHARHVNKLADIAHHARNVLLSVRAEGRGWTFQEREVLRALALEVAEGPVFSGEVPTSLKRLCTAIRR